MVCLENQFSRCHSEDGHPNDAACHPAVFSSCWCSNEWYDDL